MPTNSMNQLSCENSGIRKYVRQVHLFRLLAKPQVYLGHIFQGIREVIFNGRYFTEVVPWERLMFGSCCT